VFVRVLWRATLNSLPVRWATRLFCPHCNRSTRLSTTVVSTATGCRRAWPLPLCRLRRRQSPPSKCALGTYWLVRIGNRHAADRPRFFSGVTLTRIISACSARWERFCCSTLPARSCSARRMVAAQGGEGVLEKLRASALRRWIGRGVFHNLRCASHQQLCIIDSALLDGAIVAGLGGLHGLDCGS